MIPPIRLCLQLLVIKQHMLTAWNSRWWSWPSDRDHGDKSHHLRSLRTFGAFSELACGWFITPWMSNIGRFGGPRFWKTTIWWYPQSFQNNQQQRTIEPQFWMCNWGEGSETNMVLQGRLWGYDSFNHGESVTTPWRLGQRSHQLWRHRFTSVTLIHSSGGAKPACAETFTKERRSAP